jgi:hypothetical protein
VAGLEDVPMSDEAKSELMAREGRLAMEELLDELKPKLAQVQEAIDKFEAEADVPQAGTVAMIIVSLSMESAYQTVAQAAKRFQRRVGVG